MRQNLYSFHETEDLTQIQILHFLHEVATVMVISEKMAKI